MTTEAERIVNARTVELVMQRKVKHIHRPVRMDRPICGSCGIRRADLGGHPPICSPCAIDAGILDLKGRICPDPQGWF